MKNCLLTILLVIPISLLAQNVSINKLKPDSTQLSIIEKKQKLIYYFQFGEFDRSLTIFNKLQTDWENKYSCFSFNEQLKFHLALRNFNAFIQTVNNSDENTSEKIYLTDTLNFEADLNSYLLSESKSLIKDLDTAQLSKKESDFIQLYIKSFEEGNQMIFNHEVQKFIRSNPDKNYSGILTEIKKKPSNYMITINFTYGNQNLSGPITNNYSDKNLSIFNVEIDGFLKRFYASFIFGGNLTPFESTRAIPVKNRDLIHKEGESVQSLKVGIKTGYVIWQNSFFSLYPYFSTGIFNFLSQSPEFDIPEDEMYVLSNSIYAGYGIGSDLYIKRWQSKYTDEPDVTLYIRPTIGYDHLLSKKEISKGNCFYFTIALGVGLTNF